MGRTQRSFQRTNFQRTSLHRARFLAAASLSAMAVVSAAAPAAAERLQVTSCVSGEDARSVSVVAPGLVGAACDVSYLQDRGEYESIPFHANSASDACDVPAATLVRELVAKGFACEGPLLAVAVPDPTPVAMASSPAGAGDAETAPDRVAAAGPAPAADGGPAHLTAALTPISLEQRPPRAGRSGRLSGAPARPAPVAKASAVKASATRGAADPSFSATPIAQSAEGAPSALNAAEVLPATSAGVVPPSTEEAVKGVLFAQTAAWNAGDIDAFMDGYWKSEDLTFVSGTKVMKGWDATIDRYRRRYGEDASTMGRLAFENLEVTPTSDDVAVVVGRFRLERGGATSGGAFTLVMRDVNGAWRIVHDHTVADTE